MFSDFNSYVKAWDYRTKPEWLIDLTGYGDRAAAPWRASRKRKTIAEQNATLMARRPRKWPGPFCFGSAVRAMIGQTADMTSAPLSNTSGHR